jgi:hypothetical protein
MLVSDDFKRLFTAPEVSAPPEPPDGEPPLSEEQAGEAAGAEVLALLDAILGVTGDG